MESDEDLREAIRRLADDGRAACGALLALAERTGVPPGRIGRLCNELGVRVRACQLGLFA